MNKKVINKTDLTKRLSRKLHMHEKETKCAINVFLNCMIDALKKGKRIEIRGLGSFSVREQQNKTVRNPKTGEIYPEKTIKTVHFRPGRHLQIGVIKANK